MVKEYELTLDINGDAKQTNMPYTHRGESMTQALLRALDRVMHCSASGLSKEMPHYLQSKGLSGAYPRWVGNRFNIFFVNAGLLFMYKEHILEFFRKYIQPRNGLHRAVQNALRVEPLIPILRSLGLLDKYFTGPWMRWQGDTHNILQTSEVFTHAISELRSADCRTMIHGFQVSAFRTEVTTDEKYRKLCEANSTDEKTATIFRALIDVAIKVMERQLKDYLPGGKYHDPSPSLQAEAASCSSNNISGERVFAMWDARKQQAKTASTTKVSSKTTFKANKVRESFLAGKSKEQKAQIINVATKQARKDRMADKARETMLLTKMKDKLAESRKLIEKREENRREYKEKILEDIIKHRPWETEEDIHTGVKGKSKTLLVW